jgi:hypothetical protein
MRTLAEWVRARSQEFVRAAADPLQGVTVEVTFRAVPGLELVHSVISGRLGPEGLRAVISGSAFRGTPAGTVRVLAGRRRS